MLQVVLSNFPCISINVTDIYPFMYLDHHLDNTQRPCKCVFQCKKEYKAKAKFSHVTWVAILCHMDSFKVCSNFVLGTGLIYGIILVFRSYLCCRSLPFMSGWRHGSGKLGGEPSPGWLLTMLGASPDPLPPVSRAARPPGESCSPRPHLGARGPGGGGTFDPHLSYCRHADPRSNRPPA